MKAAADAAELNATIKQLQDSASVLQWFRAFLEQPINRELQQQHVKGSWALLRWCGAARL